MFALCGTAIIKYAFNVNGFIVSKYTDRVVMTPPIISSEQFEDEILDILKNNEKSIIAQNKKIIIFIDDLDRLAPEKMIKGLDAIRVFLDIPESNFIFIVSCHDEHIAKSISQTKTTFSSLDSARKYLDRVFQFKIDIPNIPNQSMKHFALSCLNHLDSAKLFKQDILKSNTYNLDRILNILIPIEISSPRATIQILNSYMQAWWIAKQREQKCELCDKESQASCSSIKECLLLKDIISSRLDVLAIITVIKNQFPELYNDIVIEPQILKFLLWKFIGIQNYEMIENSQLKLLSEKYQEEEQEEGYIFKKKYANLQSYLSSIQNISIPEDIKPFVVLLQDRLEMEIGGNTISIYNALITQNIQKFKDNLGIINETKTLSSLQTSQLNRAIQEVNRNEDDDRMEKAYVTLSEFAALYCGDDAKLLINDISKVLIDKNFIQNINITHIERLLKTEYISETNINNIFSYLISKLDNYNANNKEKSKTYYKKIMQLGLELHYQKNKLNETNSNALIYLFNEGTYKYLNNEEKSYYTEKVNIQFYIDNINIYGDNLLNDLTYGYVKDLLKFLNNVPEENTETYLYQIDYILQRSKDNAAKDLGDILDGGIANNNQKVINYFETLILKQNIFNKIDNVLIPRIMDSYVKRIIAHFSARKQLDDIESRIDNLILMLDIYVNKTGQASNIIEQNIASLINILSKESVILFDKLFEKYQELFKEKAENILNSFSKNIFITESTDEDNLIDADLYTLLLEKYFDNSQRENIVEIISELFEDYETDIDDFNLNKYQIFLSRLKSEFIQNEKFVSHISNVYENLELSLSNGNETFFDILIESILPMFDKIKTDSLDSLLSFITENYLTSDVDDTERFYNLMKNNWPHEDSDKLPSYSLLKIMQSAEKLIENVFNKKSELDCKQIYESINSIYQCKLVPEKTTYKKILVGCLYDIWKFDIQYAHDNLLAFLDITCNEFNYEVLCLRNSAENPDMLKDIWCKCVAIDSIDKLILRTKKFLSNRFYCNSAFRVLWFNTIKNKTNNLSILTSAIESISNEDELDVFISGKENLIKIFSNEFNEIEQNTIGKALLNLYKRTSNGTKSRKRSIALILRDLIGINGSHILNTSTLKDCSKKDIIRLSKIFTGNHAITRLINKLEKNKKIKK